MFLAAAGASYDLSGIFFLILLFAFFAFWLLCLIHCIANQKISDTNRLIGICLIIFLGPLGCALYFLLPRIPKIPRPQKNHQFLQESTLKLPK